MSLFWKILIAINAFFLICIISYIVSSLVEIKKIRYIYSRRDRFDKILKDFCEEAYDMVFVKRILPFVVSGYGISLQPGDRDYLEIADQYTTLVKKLLGNQMLKFYYGIYGSENEFIDRILLILSQKVNDTVLDIASGQTQEHITEETSEEENKRKWSNLS